MRSLLKPPPLDMPLHQVRSLPGVILSVCGWIILTIGGLYLLYVLGNTPPRSLVLVAPRQFGIFVSGALVLGLGDFLHYLKRLAVAAERRGG